jgi:hypothetical protein
MIEKTKQYIQKTDRGIRRLLGDKPLAKYSLQIGSGDTVQAVENKMIEGYFSEQRPVIRRRLLVIYLWVKHAAAILIKVPLRFILRGAHFE